MIEKSQSRDTRYVSSADRALAVLDLLADHGRPMLPMAIARQCGIPRSTTYRLLSLLQTRSYVSRDGGGRAWTLGPRVFEIAAGAPTVGQALRVLEAFDSTTPRLTVSGIAGRSSLDIQLVGRLAQAMLSDGLLSIDGAGRLALGPRVVALAARAAPIEQLVRAARPHLEHLRDRTGETANLLMRDGGSAVYLDQAESPRALRVSGWLGRRIPLASSASGAALTVGGVRVVSGGVEPGVVAVACRITGLRSVDAAVSVTAPTIRLRGARLEAAKVDVAATADAIGSALMATIRSDPEQAASRYDDDSAAGNGEVHARGRQTSGEQGEDGSAAGTPDGGPSTKAR